MSLKRFEQNIIYLDEVDSTNDYLLQLSKESALPNGSSVVAANQTKGKGQRLASWTVQAGKNLTCSTIFYPTIEVSGAFYLNIAASLAVFNVLKDLKIEAKIKWPNDILVREKKICGILVENVLQGKNVSQSIIGVGINVNQIDFGNLNQATSVALEIGREVEIKEVHGQFLNYLDFWLDWLEQKNFKLLKKHYLNSLYKLNVKHGFEDVNGPFSGTIKGISENGLLRIKTDQELRDYDIKEVKYD